MRRYRVPGVSIGRTAVAVGTNLPELSAHIAASAGIVPGVLEYRTTSAVVLGGNMGSLTTQQLLPFGILLLGFGRIDLSDRLLVDTFVPMLAGLVLTLLVSWDGRSLGSMASSCLSRSWPTSGTVPSAASRSPRGAHRARTSAGTRSWRSRCWG